ncbi:MAG: zf-HC2 domain-containing protein [Anaerolineales bacterium]|nr:zf-HC2 domain-containing protein [Anaerolineales bacterium]
MHISHADLRAHADGELSVTRAVEVDRHLAGCPDCRARRAAVAAQAQRVQAQLAALAPAGRDAPRPLGAVRQDLQERQRKDGVKNMPKLLSRRPLWAGLAAAAALAVAFSFAPVRVWAGEFLGLFRVQQVTVVPVDITRLSSLNNDQNLSEQIMQLFSESVDVTDEVGAPVVVASAAEAGQMAGFTVRGLAGPGTEPIYTVQDGGAFNVTFDVVRAQVILDAAGRSDLQLPASLNGRQIGVVIPTAVTAAYGSCPTADLADYEGDRPPADWVARRTCVMLAQAPSPTVDAPPDLDVAGLAELALQFTGMSAEEARQFSQTVDWTSTLVVPIPRNAAEYAQVEVDGVTGTLIYSPDDEAQPQRYLLMWVKDGIIYGLSGYGDSAAAVGLASTIK